MKNSSFNEDVVQCHYNGAIVPIPASLFMSMTLGIPMQEKKFVRYKDGAKMYSIYIEKYRRNIGVFFHISLMTDIPDELVMTPPPAIEFPLETEESIAELIEEQEKADEKFPVEPAPEEKKTVADTASEEAKSEESEEVKTFSLFREIDFYISCARGA